MFKIKLGPTKWLVDPVQYHEFLHSKYLKYKLKKSLKLWNVCEDLLINRFILGD